MLPRLLLHHSSIASSSVPALPALFAPSSALFKSYCPLYRRKNPTYIIVKQPFRSPMEGLRKVKTNPKLSSSSHYLFKMMYKKTFMYDPERSPPFSKNRPLADSFIESQCPSIYLFIYIYVPFHVIFF